MVKVELVPTGTNPHGATIEHPAGNSVKVQDGHLVIQRGGSDTVAIYAPGRWANATADR